MILNHVLSLANLTQASLILVHVADGYAARFQKQLNLQDSEEILKDRDYLEKQKKYLQAQGFDVKTYLLGGEPANEILSIVDKEHCDLIAMSTHGHNFLSDLLLGSVAEKIRHHTEVPILMIKAPRRKE